MKKLLTYFSNLCSSSLNSQSSDVGYDGRFTIGSPSGNNYSALLKLVSVLVLILTIGVGQMWGATYTITLTGKTLASSTKYVESATSKTLSGIGLTFNNLNPNTGQCRGNKSTQSQDFYIYNTSAFSLPITKIVLNYSSADNTWVASNVYAKTSSSSIVQASHSSGTAGTKDETANTISWEFTGTDTYFALYLVNGGTSGTATASSIVVTYGYSVTYDANGGTGTMTDASSPYASGATVTVKSNSFTAPTGKVFNGWNTKANGSGTPYAAGASFSISAHTKLYAQWVSAGTSVTLSKAATTNGSFSRTVFYRLYAFL